MAENIKPDKHNYRLHSAENKALIKKSLEECGTGRSILIDAENEIIAGNGVYEQAKKLNIPVKIVETDGNELVAIKRTDLKTNDQKRKVLAVMDNSTSDSSEFDIEALQNDFGGNELLNDFGIQGIEDIIEEGAGEVGGKSVNKSSENGEGTEEGYGENEAEDDTGYSDEKQRIIICYKKEDKEKLAQILGIEQITKILYNIKELSGNDD